MVDFGSAENPECDLDSYLKRIAAPLLGGEEQARRYVELAATVGEPEQAAEAAQVAIGVASQLTGRATQRWAWLANYLASYGYAS